MTSQPISEFTEIALQFARALTSRDYARAYQLTSREFKTQCSVEDLQQQFEDMVPLDWEFWGPEGGVELGETSDMHDFPDRKPGDVGWAYIAIYGQIYSEAVIVVIGKEDDKLKVREVEFGRP